MGPGAICKEDRALYFQLLNMTPPLEKGKYFIGIDPRPPHFQDDIKRKDFGPDAALRKSTWASLPPMMKRPWSQQEFPAVAASIAADEKPLAYLIEASKRPRRYDPLLSRDDGLITAMFQPAVPQYLPVIRTLFARAMLRLHARLPGAAWNDLLACHRLARLVGQGPTLTETTIAAELDGLVCSADEAFLQYTKLNAAQLAKVRKDLDQLPPLAKIGEKVGVTERYAFLDSISLLAREGLASADKLTEGNEFGSVSKFLLNSVPRSAIDWNRILRMGNAWYDSMAAANAAQTPAERKAAMGKIKADFDKRSQSSSSWTSMIVTAISDVGELCSQQISMAFVSTILPTIEQCGNATDRSTMQFTLDKLAFALAAYRVDHGSYPKQLATLAPKYIAEVPKDFFNNDAPLLYRPDGHGYWLYSVGPNAKDDGGKGVEDCKKEDDHWDDIAVHITAK
jgi:hypothetical protein